MAGEGGGDGLAGGRDEGANAAPGRAGDEGGGGTEAAAEDEDGGDVPAIRIVSSLLREEGEEDEPATFLDAGLENATFDASDSLGFELAHFCDGGDRFEKFWESLSRDGGDFDTRNVASKGLNLDACGHETLLDLGLAGEYFSSLVPAPTGLLL